MPSRGNEQMGKGNLAATNLAATNLAATLRGILPALILNERTKRACDIGAAITGFILFSPIFLITALAIKLESRGPVFVGEVRFGHDNGAILLVKFRAAISTKADGMDRCMSRVGRILRHSGIDELPQLINVLRGEMSIFGRRDVYRWPIQGLWLDRQND
jgi:lipopolysaccharide/colanic/teichoic acid biosynthesis glycosyltransferase